MHFLSKKQQSNLPARRRRGANERTRPTETEIANRYAFRRNRTITGSLVSEVRSANEHASQLKSPRVQTHDLHRHRRRIWLVLIGVLLCAGLLFGVLLEFIASPKIATHQGMTAEVKRSYESTIQSYLNQYPGERLRFVLNTSQLAAYLQSHGCPEVVSVEPAIQSSGLGSKTFSLAMRTPAVAWKTGGKSLYVDSKGVAFTRNYHAAPSVEIVDQSGIPTDGNRVLTSNRFLAFVGKVVGAMSKNGYTVTQIVLPANTTRQVEMRLEDVGYPIKMSVDRPAGEAAEDAARAVTHMNQKGIAPEYIDVRVSNRAYYK